MKFRIRLLAMLAAASLIVSAIWATSQSLDNNQDRIKTGMTATETNNESFLACTIDLALSVEQRNRHRNVAQEVLSAVQEIKELPNGYSLRLPLEQVMIQTAAEFISQERICCGFLAFNLDIEPNNGPLWLSLTGPEGVKELLQSELGLK